MAKSDYGSGGVIFMNNYNNFMDKQGANFMEKLLAKATESGAKGPLFKGSIDITRDDLVKLVAKAKAGKELKFDAALWPRHTQKAGHFMSISLEEPYVKPAGTQAQAQQPTGELDLSSELDDGIPF